MNQWSVVPSSWYVMAPHPENPDTLAPRWGVWATNPAGRRFAYVGPVALRTEADARDLVDRIDAHRYHYPEWSPTRRPRYWQEIDPVYGSEEYVRQGAELDRLFEERMAEGWESCYS